MKLKVEWKTKDLKTKHAWVVDVKARAEFPLCEPDRQVPYVNMLHKEEYRTGKTCSSCARKITAFKQTFPEIQIIK